MKLNFITLLGAMLLMALGVHAQTSLTRTTGVSPTDISVILAHTPPQFMWVYYESPYKRALDANGNINFNFSKVVPARTQSEVE